MWRTGLRFRLLRMEKPLIHSARLKAVLASFAVYLLPVVGPHFFAYTDSREASVLRIPGHSPRDGNTETSNRIAD